MYKNKYSICKSEGGNPAFYLIVFSDIPAVTTCPDDTENLQYKNIQIQWKMLKTKCIWTIFVYRKDRCVFYTGKDFLIY